MSVLGKIVSTIFGHANAASAAAPSAPASRAAPSGTAAPQGSPAASSTSAPSTPARTSAAPVDVAAILSSGCKQQRET